MERDALVAVALGERPAGLVVKGARLLNVYSKEIYRADVAVAGDRIAAVGDVERCIGEGTAVVDASDRFLVPGFLETHVHVGAMSLAPTEMARLLVPLGTAAIVTDFTEATKVSGDIGPAVFYLEEAAKTPLTVFLSPFYTSLLGTDRRSGIGLRELEVLLARPECVELREWNVQSHRHASTLVREAGALARAAGRLLAGHLRAQTGEVLQASVAAGVASDHEAYTVEEAVQRIRAGVAVQIRFGSAHWHETWDLLRAVTERRLDPDLVMFSTDEQELVDIRDLGFMDHRVRMAIEAGVAPVDAVRMASLNPARYLRVTGDLGGIAPGRKAFLNLVDDLRRFEVCEVVYGERVVARAGAYVGELTQPSYPPSFYDTVRLARAVTVDDLAVSAPAGADYAAVRAIGFDVETSRTRVLQLALPVEGGRVSVDTERDVVKLALIERGTGSGDRGVGFVHGTGMRAGALGFTYHPGTSELALIGADDADMALVANRIAEIGGGVVVAMGGSILAEVSMPLHGVVSDGSMEEVEVGLRGVKRALADACGVDFVSNLYRLAVLFIPGVAPELRMSVDGLLHIELAGDRLVVNTVPVVIGPA